MKMFHRLFFLLVITLMWTKVARSAPGRLHSQVSETRESENELREMIEKELQANEDELEEISEVRAESYDPSTGREVTIVVFPVEVKESKLGGNIWTDHAANEMISRLDGDIMAFEKMKKLIHFLEDSMNEHERSHLTDKKQIEDAQTILELMDKNMLIPFENNLAAIKEQIIGMDHSLQGNALGYVKKLAERAETFLKEAHEKLKVVVDSDKEWTNEEIAFKDELDHKVTEDSVSKYSKAKNLKKLNDDRKAREVRGKEFSTYPEKEINLETVELELLNQAKENIDKQLKWDLLNNTTEKLDSETQLTDEQALVKLKAEESLLQAEENLFEKSQNGISKTDTDQVEEMTSRDANRAKEATTEIIDNSDKQINPEVKNLLEKTNFWKINEQLTPHQHEQAMMIGLPFILLIPCLAIVGGIFIMCKYKKEIIAVKIVNPCEPNYNTLESPLQDVSSIHSSGSMESLNHHKEK